MKILRNLPIDNPEALKDLIAPRENQIVSMALASNEHIHMSIFTFADEETISEGESLGDTMYYVVEGETYIKQGEKISHLKTGDVLMIPANTLHSIGGKGAFKVLEIIVN